MLDGDSGHKECRGVCGFIRGGVRALTGVLKGAWIREFAALDRNTGMGD